MAFKKKLHSLNPDRPVPQIDTKRTRRKRLREPCSPADIERNVRQLLADKISGNMVGVWLLVAEYLRLGIWDLLCAWSGVSGENVEPRLAMHLVNEAAICQSVRKGRSLTQKGFELANGLWFEPTDTAIHQLLNEHTVDDAKTLQIGLGKIRRASDHYVGRTIVVDPHHMKSSSKRQTRRHRHNSQEKAVKTSQTFFCIDADTKQPLCGFIGSSSVSVTQATPGLLEIASQVLNSPTGQTLALADGEHFTFKLLAHVKNNTCFDLIVPAPNTKEIQAKMRAIPESEFTHHWPGYATAKATFTMKSRDAQDTTFYLLVQCSGERPEDLEYSGFIATEDRPELESLVDEYPKRWHIEEFFNNEQALGWKRAGTLNLNIRFARMTFALCAQAALHQLRKRLGEPYSSWSAEHFASDILEGLDGDVRVSGDRIVVTYYDAPQAAAWRLHFENLPDILRAEGVDPAIPWLYGYKLEFRFK